jgi:hypothetical protein
MADSSIDIASAALIRLGEPPISSFEEDSDTAQKVAPLYEPTIQKLLGQHNWEFATTRKQLQIDAAGTPVTGWARAFLLPSLKTDRIGQPLAFFETASTYAPKVFEYEVSGKWVFTNYLTLYCEYIRRVPEIEWPGYFEVLAVEDCAARFAMPVTEIEAKASYHHEVARGTRSEQGRGGLYKEAIDADNRGAPTRSFLDDDDPMTAARFGGNSRGGRW